MPTPRKDITGQRFTRWLVMGYRDTRRRVAYWQCRCDCGTERVVEGTALRTGRSQSCGCFHREVSSRQAKRLFTKHGHTINYTDTPEYRSWYAMLKRCENPNTVSFVNYGARGITVCERWHTFESFLADMGLKPSTAHTIDRINNDGNYEPNNCRWATRSQQNANRRMKGK